MLAAVLLLADSSLAAPTVSVNLSRIPEEVHRGDETVSYEVEVRNTSPVDSTSGTLTLSFAASPGVELKAASGSGWTCAPPLSCSTAAAVTPGGSYPVLSLDEVLIDEVASSPARIRIDVSGGGAAPVSAEDSFTIALPLPFGFSVARALAMDELGGEETQAGGHPYEVSAGFLVTHRRGRSAGSVLPIEDLHGGVGELPAGMVANPTVVGAVCDFAELRDEECPAGAAVGGVRAFMGAPGELDDGDSAFGLPKNGVVYRLRRERGYPASFGFKTSGPAFVIRLQLRADGDYGFSQLLPLVPQVPTLYGINLVLCGYGARLESVSGVDVFDRCKRRGDADANPRPLVTAGTSCAGSRPLTRFSIDSWTHRGRVAANGLPDLSDPAWSVADLRGSSLGGCELLNREWTGDAEPSFDLEADRHVADAPAAYTAHIHVPQDGLDDSEGLATPHLEDAKVTLPPGLGLNPALADRLETCSKEQIGLIGTGFPLPNRIRFDTELPTCPEASKIGTVRIRTPLLEETLPGSIFLAAQGENPFGTDYAAYITVEAPQAGIVAKLPVELDLDSRTGNVSAVLRDGPQLPFEDLWLRLFGGERSVLASPSTCGPHGAETALTPWSAADLEQARADEVARPTAELLIDSAPEGLTCSFDRADRPFEVGFSAGSENGLAGAASPFLFRVTRADGFQEVDRLEISAPPGFSASLKGIPYCSDAEIDAAHGVGARAERRSPSCPPASKVGTTLVGVGAGASPFYMPGNLYLAGPYKGAPLSLVAITPALAGPFDLGNVVIRSTLRIDRKSAQTTIATDPIPQVFGGIALRLRDLRVDLDRPGWTATPTDCTARSVDLIAWGANGAVSRRSTPFQVGGCEGLAFKPRLSVRLSGAPPRRGGHPQMKAVLRARPGDAGIRRAAIVLPETELLENSHIRGVCPRPRFVAGTCPQRSVYGAAMVWSPLLDEPLRGPVYLRASDGRLPDLVAALDGQLRLDFAARVDSVGGRVRTTFEGLPDFPLSRLALTLDGGRRGLLVNNTRLCRAGPRAAAFFRAHNDKARRVETAVRVAGCGKMRRERR